MVSPVMKPAASEARKAISAATSCGVPIRPTGIIDLIAGGSAVVMAEATGPGATAFTVMPRLATSRARYAVMACTPALDTPQMTVMDPTTIYGISKLAGERLCEYYHLKYGVDVRSIRYPGIISYKSPPGGGTTDYAIAIFHAALRGEQYQCFLGPQTTLPMIYMPDAIRATIELMEAPAEQVKVRSAYNVAGVSFNPEQLAAAITRAVPDFKIAYKPDSRQAIADTWPQSLDDATATADFAVTQGDEESVASVEPITLGRFRSWNAGDRVLNRPGDQGFHFLGAGAGHREADSGCHRHDGPPLSDVGECGRHRAASSIRAQRPAAREPLSRRRPRRQWPNVQSRRDRRAARAGTGPGSRASGRP